MLGLRLHPLACATSVVIMLLAGACSGGDLATDNPLSLIPSDATSVLAVDMRTALIESGCHSRNGVIELNDVVSDLVDDYDSRDMLQTLASNSRSCRLDMFVAFTDSATQRRFAIVPRIPDTTFNVDGLEGGNEQDSEFLGTVASYRSGCIYNLVVAERCVWLLDDEGEGTDPIAAIDGIVKRAVAAPMRKVEAVASLIDDTSLLVRYYRADSAMKSNPFGSAFTRLLASATLKNNAITLEAACFDSDWQQVNPVSAMQTVDAGAFSSFIPSNTAFMAAMAADSEQFDALKALLTAKLDSGVHRLAAGMIFNLLGEFSGTLAVALAPGGNRETIADFDPSTWQMCLVAPLSDDSSAERLIAGVSGLLKKFASSGLAVTETNDGLRISTRSTKSVNDFYLAVIERNVILSTYAIDSRDIEDGTSVYGSDEFDRAAGDACLFAAAEIPFKSELMYACGLPCGFAADIRAENDGVVRGRVTAFGSSSGILPMVLQILENDIEIKETFNHFK